MTGGEMDSKPFPTGLTEPHRDALASAGIHNGSELLAWAARQVVDLMRAHNDRLRPSVARGEEWLSELAAPVARLRDEVEHLDATVLDGWETEASFTIYFLERQTRANREAQVLAVRNEADDEEQAWPGRDCSRLCGWLLDQLDSRTGPSHRGPGHQSTDQPDPSDQHEPTDHAALSEPRRPSSMSRYRTFNGTDNGAPERNVGRTGRPLRDLGLTPTRFDPARSPNPRKVSTVVCSRGANRPDPFDRSEMVWAWGQFLDHELDLISTVDDEPMTIVVPNDDPRVEWRGSTMTVNRSARDDASGLPNEHTAYVDASNVYGTRKKHAKALRTGTGGLLRHSTSSDGRELLPDRVAPSDPIAGDPRAEEHPVLTSLHTVWLREHNRLCRVLADDYGVIGDEELFQRARQLVGAQMQVITYEEFLPALLGSPGVPPWTGFQAAVDPGISNLFATAAYRLGHSMVNGDLVLGPGTRPLPLRDVFFWPDLVEKLGVERILGGLVTRPMRAVDTAIVDGLREHLFPEPQGGPPQLRDLAVLNMARGRDHELPAYNDVRRHFGLSALSSFGQLTNDSQLAADLTRLYGSPDRVDLWPALLAETPKRPRRVGDLLFAILVDQFTRLRDGDHHWWQHDPNLLPHEREWVGRRRLVDVLRANTGLKFDACDDVFVVHR